jgi:hypothetical protein
MSSDPTITDDLTTLSAKATISGLPSFPGTGPAQASATVVDLICEEASRVCERQFGQGLHTLILTGSFARGEGSLIRHKENWQALSDAEFMVVLADSVRLSSATEQREMQTKTTHALQARGIHCSLSFGLVHADFLRKLQPSIFAFELRACGRVLSGDAAVLSLIPRFRSSEIPAEDAWRLLCNRLVECLEVLSHLESECESVLRQDSYRIVKLYLDMCTSLLVFCGGYEPRYAQRTDALSRLAQSDPAYAPFSLREFSKQVSAATGFKISGISKTFGISNRKELASVTAEAMAYARQLWRWELKKMTNSDDDPDDSQLLKRWMSQQGMAHRVRGWAYVCRKQGWHRSWREWARWLRLLRLASPRYCVYAVASEMCFGLPPSLDGARGFTDSNCQRWRDFLPMRKQIYGSDCSPQSKLMAETVWNYEQFLVGTRA